MHRCKYFHVTNIKPLSTPSDLLCILDHKKLSSFFILEVKTKQSISVHKILIKSAELMDFPTQNLPCGEPYSKELLLIFVNSGSF